MMNIMIIGFDGNGDDDGDDADHSADGFDVDEIYCVLSFLIFFPKEQK